MEELSDSMREVLKPFICADILYIRPRDTDYTRRCKGEIFDDEEIED